MEQVVVPAEGSGDAWLIHRDVYPPGGANTLMRQCPHCRRICPPNGPTGSPCCDCQAEDDWSAMSQWLADPSRRDLLPELRRLSHLSCVSYSRFKRNPNGGALGTFVDVEPDEPGSQWRPIGDDRPSYSRPGLADEAIRKADTFLRRHAGCSVALLPEDEGSLQDEIAYFAANGTIMPRARKSFFRIVPRG